MWRRRRAVVVVVLVLDVVVVTVSPRSAAWRGPRAATLASLAGPGGVLAGSGGPWRGLEGPGGAGRGLASPWLHLRTGWCAALHVRAVGQPSVL